MRIGGQVNQAEAAEQKYAERLKRRWLKHNKDMYALLTPSDIEYALSYRDLPQAAYKRIELLSASFVNDGLKPVWMSAAQDGGQAVTSGIRRASAEMQKGWLDGWLYTPTGEYILGWIAWRAGALIREWGLMRRGVLSLTIAETITGNTRRLGIPPTSYYLGEAIKGAFGLTERQVGWVQSYADKLWDALLSDPATSALPTSRLQVVVDSKVRAYRYGLTQYRAQTIARTEAAAAANAGQYAAMKEAIEDRRFGEYKVYKSWFASKLDPCEDCQQLDGMEIPFDATFQEHGDGGASALHPPLHPNCRCTLVYTTKE